MKSLQKEKENKKRFIFSSEILNLLKREKEFLLISAKAYRFEFKNKYGDFDKDDIGCHHENVLSEHPEKELKDYITTSLDSVKVFCSNCYRMMHHKGPALTFDELLKLLE